MALQIRLPHSDPHIPMSLDDLPLLRKARLRAAFYCSDNILVYVNLHRPQYTGEYEEKSDNCFTMSMAIHTTNLR